MAFGGAVADSALSSDTQGVFQGLTRFTLVQADLSAALHVGVKQPVDDEQGTFDATDFAQGKGQLVLARIGCLASFP